MEKIGRKQERKRDETKEFSGDQISQCNSCNEAQKKGKTERNGLWGKNTIHRRKKVFKEVYKGTWQNAQLCKRKKEMQRERKIDVDKRKKKEAGRKMSRTKREEIALNAVRIESEAASCKL